MKSIDLTGKQFGRLTVTGFDSKKGRHKSWKCLCVCGKIKIVAGTNLRGKKTSSCGCLLIEMSTKRIRAIKRVTFDPGIGSCNYLWNRYRQGAKQRELPFEVSKEEFLCLTSSNCHYCGSKPKLKVKGPRSNGVYVFNGIDRKNSDYGYITGNMLSCCKTCNLAKNDMSYEDFIEWIDILKNFNIKDL